MSRHRWRLGSVAGAAILALGLGLVALPAAGNGDEAVVRTDAGPVRGTVTEDSRQFRGIPYAAPPVGALRWQSPQPVEPWAEVRDATQPGGRCAQTGDPNLGSPASETEDCLYLEVTAPRSATPDEPKPVMVWLHGGGLTSGAGSDYDARKLAVDGDVVVVSVNYRLGIFGFLSHPGLEDAGAFGFEDQQAALRWVQANAAAFGGDADNVTLFGESAGAESTCTQLTSPSAAGLFDKAVTMSSSCVAETAAPQYPRVLEVPTSLSRQEADGYGMYLAGELGCANPADVACLRGLSTAELLRVPMAPRPTYGNETLPEDPQKVLREGRFHKVPLLTGVTRDEGTMWISLIYPEAITAEGYEQLLDEFFGAAADSVARRYPLHAFETPGQAWAAIMGDREWVNPEQVTTELLSQHVPVYAYEFNDRQAPPILPFPPHVPPGASHGSDVSYLLPSAAEPVQLNPDQQELSDRMIGYWTGFAHDGDPNGSDLPEWPQLNADDAAPYVQELAPGDGGIGPFNRTREHKLDFWEALG